MSGANAFATNTTVHTGDTPQLLLDHHLLGLRLSTVLREHKMTRQCAVEQVDSGRAVIAKTVASALSARDDDPTPRIVESGSVHFAAALTLWVPLCREHPTGCGKKNPCANSAWEW
jgi:hypothetical protein